MDFSITSVAGSVLEVPTEVNFIQMPNLFTPTSVAINLKLQRSFEVLDAGAES